MARSRWRLGLYSGWGLLAVLLAAELLPERLPATPVARASPIEAAHLLPPLAPPSAPPPKLDGTFELTLRTSGAADLQKRLNAAGVDPGEAARAVELLRDRLGEGLGGSADVKVNLGEPSSKGGRSLVSLAVLSDLGVERVARSAAGVDVVQSTGLERASARIEGGTYWSLRKAGLAPEIASEAARLAEHRLGAVEGGRVTAVVGERPARFGQAKTGRLLLLAVEGHGRHVRRLLAWPTASGGWVDPARPVAQRSPMAWPVTGRITSHYGTRFHPILQFFRPHRGLDFAARHGEPVRAAADGCVIRAAWSGGYGRQVRLVHRDALATSYSHLSSLAVNDGQCVRRGDVIGLAGASGLATGPHLHFELSRAGQAIDPHRMLGAPSAVDAAEQSAIAARLALLGRV